MKHFFTTLVIFLSYIFWATSVLAQVDITKYASDDLFEIKPVITQEYLEQKEEEENPSYNSQLELEIAEGMKMWAGGEYDDAVYHFEKMADEYGSVLFTYYCGLINFEREDYNEAKEYFIESIANEPLFLEAKYMMGMIALEENDLKAARDYFKILSEVPEYEAYGDYGLGKLAMEEGNIYAVTKYFKRCIEADTTFLDAYIPLIVIDLYYEKYKHARKLIEQALRSDGEWQEGIMIRGMISLLQDQSIDQFEEDINTLIKLDPSNYHYYSMKGFLEMELGRFHEAVKMFKKAYNLELDSVRVGEFKFNSRFQREEPIQRALNYYFDHYVMESSVRNFLDKGICELG